MHGRIEHRFHLRIMLATVLLAFVGLLASSPLVTFGVSSQGQVATTLSNDTISSSNVTYTFGNFRVANKEEVPAVEITFPADTDVSGAVAVSPLGTVTVSGQTVRIDFAAPVPQRSSKFTLSVGGITNPSTPGAYNVGNIIFYTADLAGAPTGSTAIGSGPDYTILDGWLTLAITTPGLTTGIDFGAVDPDVPSPLQTVTVEVDAPFAYDISRTLAGDAALMGLTVTGDAVGAKTAGVGLFSDDYQVNPPWTTTPSTPLTATVTYTVVQQ